MKEKGSIFFMKSEPSEVSQSAGMQTSNIGF
jgi:hypothetical protein